MIKSFKLGVWICFIIPGLLSAQQRGDFRGTSWGMTKSEVQSIEKRPLQGSSKTSLAYQDSIAGINVVVGYTFSSDDQILIAGGYLSQSDYKERNQYLGDYNAMKQYLIGRYGKPEVDKIRWLNNFFKDKPEKRGLALALGHVYYLTKWDTENTVIIMTMMGRDYNIEHLVSFRSKKYNDRMQPIRKKAEQIYKEKYSD